MSTIEKLSIQGIRSFGHEDTDKQVVEFFKPLTLIVGHNGAGKTTIIECLRYVCSGDQPPGSKSCFVHDPKVAHETEVKGQVKLKFKDKVGENVIVTRNLMATQKAKRTEFKSLEGTIRRVNQLGAPKSLSSKCAEIDREMVESLGVSKPVLVNVIFCHQEEANWPLSEGKQLKNKFDEIFAATRYIKAVENIKKIRLEQQGSIRELTIESRYLRDDKDKARQLNESFENQQVRLIAARESVSKIDAQMAPLQDDLEDIEKRELDVQKLDNEIAKLKAGRDQMLMSCREIEEGLQSVFEGSMDELKKMYKDHQKETERKKKTLEEREREYNQSTRTLAKLRDNKSKLLTLFGKLQQEAEHHERLKASQKDCVKQMAELMNIPGYHGMVELTAKQLANFRKEVEAKKKNLLDELHQMKKSYETKEQEFDNQSQGLRDTKSKLEQSVSMKTKQINDNREDIQLISAELNRMEDNAHRIRELEDELRKANLDLDKAVQSVNIEELRKEIERMKADKKQKDGKLSELRKEMSKLSKQSEILTKLEMWEKEKRKKEDSIKKIRSKHEEEMTHLLGHFPSANARNQLEDFIVGKKREVSQNLEQLQRAKIQKSTEESNQKHILHQLKEKEGELREIEEKLMLECGSQDIGKSLQSLQQSISNLQSERGALTGSTHLYERYIRSLERTEAQCPLCHRGFDAEEEVHELIQELRDKLRLAPAKMKEKEKSLIQQREKLSKLQKMEPLKEKMTKLSEQEIPNLKTRLAAVTEKLNKLNTKIEEEEESLTMLQGDETIAVNMKPDIIMLDQNLTEVKNLDRQIGTLQQRISSDGRMRTSEEVNKEYGDLEAELDTLNNALERKQRQRDDYSENVEILRANINSLSTEKLRLSEQLQQQDKLETRKIELATTNKELQKDVEESKKEIKPIQSKLKELENKKKELLMKKEDALVTIQDEVKTISENVQEVERFTREINRYTSSGKSEELESNKSKIDDLKEELSKEEREESNLKKSIDQLKEDIVGEEVQERELYDNIQLKKKRSEVEEVNGNLKKLEEQRGSMDSTGLVREKRKLNNKLASLFKERNQADGRQSVLKEEVKKIESELNSEKYKTAEEKFTDVMIKLKTLEVTNKDLDKYSKALDTAIMKYHKLKMEEINKIIKEYWRMTYKGNDIDYIEIRSEADTSVSTTLRRNYNYRVVMVKGDTEMDMRGRCSAGQKVLASLIIRLALAETFCLSCGILALDEPTTNLDRVNIEGLAHALVDIIKTRENQKNFQLIVITHDEDFVELLGRSDYADYFYRVTKNNEAKSVIYKKDMAALA